MAKFLFESGQGAFALTLIFFFVFSIAFAFVIYWKGFAAPKPSTTDHPKLVRTEAIWILVALTLFLVVNMSSIPYMPTVISNALAANSSRNHIQDVNILAVSWAFDISNRNLQVGQPIRFSGTSFDTLHGFAVYQPDGRLLFTMMLIPGMPRPTSLIHVFEKAGTYTVRCLEYCGTGHANMQDRLTVVNNTSKSSPMAGSIEK